MVGRLKLTYVMGRRIIGNPYLNRDEFAGLIIMWGHHWHSICSRNKCLWALALRRASVHVQLVQVVINFDYFEDQEFA